MLPTPVFLGFPCGSAGKESACNAEDLGSTPGLGRSPREGKGYPLQYSGLENSAHDIFVNMSFEDINDCQLFQENPHSLAFLWWPCWWLWRIPDQEWMCPRWKQCGLSSVAAELFIFNKQHDWSFEKLPGKNQPANFEVALKPPAGTFRVPGPTGLSFSVVRSILGLQAARSLPTDTGWHDCHHHTSPRPLHPTTIDEFQHHTYLSQLSFSFWITVQPE